MLYRYLTSTAKRVSIFMFFLGVCVTPSFLYAQTLYNDVQEVVEARVIKILESGTREVVGTNVTSSYQVLLVQILEGEEKGEELSFENDFVLLEEGDVFYANHLRTIDGQELWSVYEPKRTELLFLIVGLFVLVVLLFGRWQGFRSLVSLLGSFLIIFYFLLPRLLSGASPLPTSIFFAIVILAFAIYITHGFRRITHTAFIGTAIATLVTGALAFLSVHMLRLSGFASDEAVYLNIGTRGTLDMQGLLLGAIIIGMLGVLDDVAITQAAAVQEIKNAAPNLGRLEVFRRAIRIGREHVGALINTLVLAYTGTALPLLLLFYGTESSLVLILNREIFATEIIRAVVGSLGLILTVPLTTFFAAYYLQHEDEKEGGYSSTGHHHPI